MIAFEGTEMIENDWENQDDPEFDDLTAVQVIAVGLEKVNRSGKFSVGQIVQHRHYAFRGVIFDVDPTFSNSEEWLESIPEEVRPKRDQPYYHLLAENEETTYIAYVSEQNLEPDLSGRPVRHPQIGDFFSNLEGGTYKVHGQQIN